MSTDAFRSSLRVLIVDDEADLRDVLAQSIARLGHWCATAADGAEAMELHRREPFDVVVSDWNMPNVNGLELCERVRAHDGEEGYTYFVFTTGMYDREHVLKGMRAGADDYLVKPIDVDALEVRLLAAERLVGLHRRRRAKSVQLRHDSHRLFVAAHTDPLTRVGNRLRLDQDLAELWGTALAASEPWSSAMIDVDLFKLHNDRFGHLAGDETLRRIAQAARSALRAADRVYRYGGEEFVALLPRQTHQEASIAMERVRAAVEALAIAQPDAPAKVVTVSIGVAQLLPQTDLSAEAWLKRADDALYRAKGEGRNRIAVDTPTMRAAKGGKLLPSTPIPREDPDAAPELPRPDRRLHHR